MKNRSRARPGRGVTALSVVLLALLWAGGAEAQLPAGVEGSYQPHPEARKAISKLLSPYCPGFMLEVCPSSQAQALRDSIHTMAVQGSSSEELVAWMLENHGREYLAMPERSGSGFFAWLLPPLVLLLGAFGVVMALRRFRPASDESGDQSHSPGDRTEPAHDILPPETEERLRDAIRELELSEDPL